MLAPSIFSVSKPEIQFSLFANLYEDVVAISVLRGVINRSSQSHLRQRLAAALFIAKKPLDIK